MSGKTIKNKLNDFNYYNEWWLNWFQSLLSIVSNVLNYSLQPISNGLKDTLGLMLESMQQQPQKQQQHYNWLFIINCKCWSWYDNTFKKEQLNFMYNIIIIHESRI